MTATPYYVDDAVTLYHADALEWLPEQPASSVACVITDPPYTERTHANQRSRWNGGHGKPDVITKGVTKFGAITDDDLTTALVELGRVTCGWVIATLDYRHAVGFDVNPPAGLAVRRVGVWVKTNPTPQLSGDRPAQGWEAIAYMHRADSRSRWNGGGKHGNFITAIPRPEGHPTAKPLSLVADLVRLFTDPGDVVLDPFAGSGTTLRAAKDEGRNAVGLEVDERYCELIAKRLTQDTLFGELV